MKTILIMALMGFNFSLFASVPLWTDVVFEQSSDTWEVAALAKLEKLMEDGRYRLRCRCSGDEGKLSCEKPWVRCRDFLGFFTDCEGRQKCDCQEKN